jgi:hypothetical protein
VERPQQQQRMPPLARVGREKLPSLYCRQQS